MTSTSYASPARFEGHVANIARDGTIAITSAPPGPPRRIDGYTIGAIPNIDGPGPHGGEVHPDGDEFLYVVSGAMELILDNGDERAVGVEAKVLLGSCHGVCGTGSKRWSRVTSFMSHPARMVAIDHVIRLRGEKRIRRAEI